MGILSFIATLFWGVLAGTIVAGLAVYLISELMGTPKWLIGLISTFLFFFLSFQFTVIIGAGKVKGLVADITVLSNTAGGKADWNAIQNSYPVLKPYIEKVETTVNEATDKKGSVLSFINSTINSFMWRHAAWAFGGIIVCFVVAALPELTGNGRTKQGRRGAGASSHRRTTRQRRPQRR